MIQTKSILLTSKVLKTLAISNSITAGVDISIDNEFLKYFISSLFALLTAIYVNKKNK